MRLRPFGPSRVISSNVAIGTASAFVAATALLSLAIDRAPGEVFGAGWTLRGALAPLDQPSAHRKAPIDAAPQKAPRWT